MIETLLPQWKCHKVVRAAEITGVWPQIGDGPRQLIVDCGSFGGNVPWPRGRTPDDPIGGYYVVYEDGYTSWSPGAEFRTGYTRLPVGTETTDQASGAGLDFGAALGALKLGGRVARAGWNGKGMWLLMQGPDAHSKMTLPYIYMEYPAGHPAYPNGCRVPWLASQTDMLAGDWVVLGEGEAGA